MNKVNYDEFTQNLVLIMIGVKLENLEPHQQQEISTECINIYKHYIAEYFANHFPDIDISRFNALDLADKDNHSITIGLAQKIQTAYLSFVSHLEESWPE